jgi:uncharacterized protein (DUF1810 family)
MSFDLNRFIKAQNVEYEGYNTALNEIRNGKKQSHWIWYIFPQLKQLGRSSTAQHYGISNIKEARAYWDDLTLRNRLLEITQALLELEENDPVRVLGYTDAMKVKSCMTLFLMVDSNIDVFRKVIDKYYQGRLDDHTVDIIEKETNNTDGEV